MNGTLAANEPVNALLLEWPDQWRMVDPSAVPGSVVVAIREGLDEDYIPIMSVRTTLLSLGVSLERYADQAAERFASEVGGAYRIRRTWTEDGAMAPGLSQLLTACVVLNGVEVDLRRFDGFLGSPQTNGDLAVIALSLTCTVNQLKIVGPEFGEVLTSLN